MAEVTNLFSDQVILSEPDQKILWKVVHDQRQGAAREWMIRLLATGATLVVAGVALTIHNIDSKGVWLTGIGTVICFFATVRIPVSWSLHDSGFLMKPIDPQILLLARNKLSDDTVKLLKSQISLSSDRVLRISHLLNLLHGVSSLRRQQQADAAIAKAQIEALTKNPPESLHNG